MNKKIIIILSIIIAILAAIYIIHCCFAEKIINEYKQELLLKDSIYNNDVDSLNEIIIQDEELIEYYKKGIDSYIITIDSLNEELLLSNVKLERIKEYNRIAGQGNNITFLRGWINRVLNQ